MKMPPPTSTLRNQRTIERLKDLAAQPGDPPMDDDRPPPSPNPQFDSALIKLGAVFFAWAHDPAVDDSVLRHARARVAEVLDILQFQARAGRR